MLGIDRLDPPAGLTDPREVRRQLGSGIWLLLLLNQWQTPPDLYVRSGTAVRAEELAAALGVGERQVRRDLQRLRKAGYLELQNTGRGFRIRLTCRREEAHPSAAPRAGVRPLLSQQIGENSFMVQRSQEKGERAVQD